MRRFVCDDAAIFGLRIRKDLVERETKVQLDFSVSIHVPSPQDKLVSVRFTMKDGDGELLRRALGPLDAEEGRVTQGRLSWRVDRKRFETLFEGDQAPELTLLVRVSNN